MDFPTELQRVLESAVRLIVDRPDDVRILLTQAAGINLVVQVSPVDLGKVIGKTGRTARAMRTLLTAMAQTACTTVKVDFYSRTDLA